MRPSPSRARHGRARGWRRAGWLALGGSALVLLVWLATAMLAATRVDANAGEGGSLRVSTRFPLATCSKTFTAEFPWVHFACDVEGEER